VTGSSVLKFWHC